MKNARLASALALVLFGIGCGAGPVSKTSNPLVASFWTGASKDGTVSVQFGLDTRYGFETSAVPLTANSSTSILVAGMKPQTTYHMRAVTQYSDGTQDEGPDYTFTTGSAPAGRVPQTAVTGASNASPGVELLALNPGGTNDANLRIVALDPSGNLIWYYDFEADLGIAQPVKLLPNGHFLGVFFGGTGFESGGVIREFDLEGKTVRQLALNQLNIALQQAGYNFTANSIHHDIVALPNGHLLILVNSMKSFTNLPGYPGTTSVLGDHVVDLDPNFTPVWTWSSFDHLDVNRHPMEFPDWTHTNTILYSPDDGNIVLSLRHQNWIIKIDYANGHGTGDILWRLGYEGDFTLLNSSTPADWFYAQHYANIISPNTTGDMKIGMFDNGDDRVLDAAGDVCGVNGMAPCYSRGAYFDVNDQTMTAQLLWAYTPGIYSFWGGVLEQLPNSDIYMDETTPSDNPKGARVLELTNTATPQVLWELNITGQNSYRTLHLPSLYPGVQW